MTAHLAEARRHAVAVAVISVACTLTLGACASSPSSSVSGPVQVVASTNVWGDIASYVGGNDVTVTSFISDPAQDPHSFEASSTTLLAVSRAALVVENGGGYDDFMNRLVAASGSKAAVVNAVDVSGKTGTDLNEHVWYDLVTSRRVAHDLAVDLARIAPRHAARFRARAARFSAGIDRLIDQEQALKGVDGGLAIGITEPVPLYLTSACGLRNATPAFSEAVEQGDDVGPALLERTLEEYRDHRVDALVYNQQTSGPVTERVKAAADAAGIAVVPVTETMPAGLHYLGWMQRNLTRLREALVSR